MNDIKNEITSSQLMCFCISAQLGVGSLFLPAVLADKAGHDGWIAVLVGNVICLIYILIIMSLLKRYGNKTIFDINFLVYGKILGYIFNIFIIGYLISVSGEVIRLFAETTKIISLKFTPPLVTTIMLLVPIVYISLCGLKIICRFDTLLYFSCFILLFSFYLLRKEIRPTFLLPVLESGFKPIIGTLNSVIFSFLGFELSAIFYPNVKDKNKALKYMIFELLFITFIFTSLVLVSTAIYGENKLKMIVFPIYSLEQSITVPVIERLDTFFIMFWLSIMGINALSYMYASYHSIRILFNLKSAKILLAILFTVEIIISRIPNQFEDIYTYADMIGYYGTIIISFMAITFLLSFIRKKGVVTK